MYCVSAFLYVLISFPNCNYFFGEVFGHIPLFQHPSLTFSSCFGPQLTAYRTQETRQHLSPRMFENLDLQFCLAHPPFVTQHADGGHAMHIQSMSSFIGGAGGPCGGSNSCRVPTPSLITRNGSLSGASRAQATAIVPTEPVE